MFLSRLHQHYLVKTVRFNTQILVIMSRVYEREGGRVLNHVHMPCVMKVLKCLTLGSFEHHMCSVTVVHVYN